MEIEGATDWAEAYQHYMKRLHDEEQLAADYLQDLQSIKAQQPLTAAGIMRLLRSDSMIDIIVGGTDGRFHLLHNFQMVVENGTLLVAGISGRGILLEIPTHCWNNKLRIFCNNDKMDAHT
jgi:hypothetical protein